MLRNPVGEVLMKYSSASRQGSRVSLIVLDACLITEPSVVALTVMHAPSQMVLT